MISYHVVIPDILPSSFRSWNASETKLERLCGYIHLEWYGWIMMKYSWTKNGIIQNNCQIRVTQLRAGNLSAKIEKIAWPSSFHQLVSMAQFVSTKKSHQTIHFQPFSQVFLGESLDFPPKKPMGKPAPETRWIPVACLGLRIHSLGGHRGASDRSPGGWHGMAPK